jgi:hypothetical protein
VKKQNLGIPLAAALAPALVLAASGARADDAPAAPVVTTAPAPGGDSNGTAPSVTVVQMPAAPAQTQTVYGPLPPPGWNPDAHLDSSARTVTDTNGSGDGFDFKGGPAGPTSFHGNPNGAFNGEGSGAGFVPELHTVRRGDTLWEISGKYYANPYQWPRIWAQNPQIQNPHWIYPGDRVRLRDESIKTGAAGFHRRGASVPPQTVFLRDQGWIDNRRAEEWGEVVGSPDDQMMLSESNEVYLQLREGHDIAIGSLLTIFRPIRRVESSNTAGELISIRGTARVDRFNPKTHMVRAKVIEALDVIERGALVGPVNRRFVVVPPVRSDVDLDARILAAVYPYHFYGQNQVIFIDRGEKDGVRVGMRFFAVRRGDPWIDNLDIAGEEATKRPRVEDDRPSRYDQLRTTVDDELLPDETYAEVRVVGVRDHTATVLVTASKHEIESNARLVARKGL